MAATSNLWWGFTDGYHTGMLSSIGVDKEGQPTITSEEGHNTGMGHTETRALHKLMLYETACFILKVSYPEVLTRFWILLGWASTDAHAIPPIL